MEFLPGGLHSRPRELRQQLQSAIDQASAERRGDMLAIGYGVCGLGTVGLHARSIPLVIPRVNDCIALFLGSDAAYRTEFARYPGTYYISAGWVQEKGHPQDCGTSKEQPDPDRPDFDQLVSRHGQENAEAIRYFLNSWQRNYQRAAFIDTGVAGRQQYARIARTMAEEFGWKYEELTGSGELLSRLLTQRESADDILVVLPHHVTVYDPVRKGLSAMPIWDVDGAQGGGQPAETLGLQEPQATQADTDATQPARLGLGIDAGGTYTDIVVYDFVADTVVQKAKALTTKWDYMIGIDEALDQLDPHHLSLVDLVSISTTLATNAIVEERGQKAGLLIMPPYGLFDPQDISYRPLAVLRGKLEIDGKVIEPVDRDQVASVVREMVAKQGVSAFAVTGYASHANPTQELEVKAIIQQATGLSVTCGHEVSEGVNYRVRAETAALNARIIRILEKFLDEACDSLKRRGIKAPVMVVKSDGSLMGVETARQCPIQTILSGPAASVAGASYLAKLSDALVVDIGGTTTDTATISGGSVRTCEDGASVGRWRTHVRALDMRTLGLGGDSAVTRKNGQIRIGPRRVAPVCWMASRYAGAEEALAWLKRRLDGFVSSTAGMELLVRTAGSSEGELDDAERRILELLDERPMSLDELVSRTDSLALTFLPVARLEERHLVQRCGLTPTDLLHLTGQVSLWEPAAAQNMADLYGMLAGMDSDKFAQHVLRQFVHHLAVELFKKELGDAAADELDASPAAQAMIENMLSGGSQAFRVQVQLRRPIIGIGAPVHLFLPQAAEILQTRAVIPPNADVANAIGAITSSIHVCREAEIVPDDAGRYSVRGLENAPSFRDFDQAHQYAVQALRQVVLSCARAAGTSASAVEIIVQDRIGKLRDGGQLFVGRKVAARLTGRPDLSLS